MMDCTAEQLDSALHDAWVDFSSIQHESGELVMTGEVERPYRDAFVFSRVAKFPFSLSFQEVVSFVAEDDEEIGGLLVSDITYNYEGNFFLLEGAIPGRLMVATPKAIASLMLSPTPLRVRRWLSWHKP